MALAGVFGDALGVRTVFYIAGGIAIAAGLLSFVLLNEPAPAPVVESGSA